jgi:hypothetical protein
MDGFYEEEYQNLSAPDWSMFNHSFTVAPIPAGEDRPELDADGWGVSQAQIPELDGNGTRFVLEFWVKVTDSDGVPDNIKTVTVSNPALGEQAMYLNWNPSADVGYYYAQKAYARAEEVPEGDFTFHVTDHDTRIDTLIDSLVVSGVPVPVNPRPRAGRTVGLRPIFSWDEVSNAPWYKVRLFKDWYAFFMESSALQSTVYELPVEQQLVPEGLYEYRVYAFHEDPDAGDIDNLSITTTQPGMMQYFWTSEDPCEGNFDGDSDVDGSDLATFATDFGRTDCNGDCEGDFDFDGDVDGSDLAVFSKDFGRTDCP